MLGTADNNWNKVGERIYNVTVEGVAVDKNIDIIARVGKNAAHDLVVTNVQVNDGSLTVKLDTVVDAATLTRLVVGKGTYIPTTTSTKVVDYKNPTSASSSSTSSSSSSSSGIGGTVYMQWVPPKQRANGTPITLSDIAGYELRYKLSPTANETIVSLPNGGISGFRVSVPVGYTTDEVTGKIRALGTDGSVSEFTPSIWSNPEGDIYPLSVKDLIATCKNIAECEYTQIPNTTKTSIITINKNQ